MDLKQIKDLMAAMGRTGTKKLAYKTQEYELKLEREGEPVYKVFSGAHDLGVTAHQTGEAERGHSDSKIKADIPPALNTPVSGADKQKEPQKGIFVTSPMVGTFYSAPSPNDPSFVKVGDAINKDTVVCIVEAMKVMNEVKAGVSGTIKEILLDSGHPVEFGTKLYRIV